MIDVDDMSVRILERALPREVFELSMLLRRTRLDVYEHSIRVGSVARRLARAACFCDADIDIVVVAAYLHDIGKTFIPEAVLYKPGPHDADERLTMRRHALIGETCLSPFPLLRDVAMIVGQHHEHVDGGGYPRRLAGEDIDRRARVLAIADATVAMTEERPYQRAVSPEQAITEIRRCAGTHFDRDFVAAMRVEFLF